jgi:hypothetical protein
MSTKDERLNLIEQNYKDALENEPHDLARAKKPEQVAAIQANVAVARQTYYEAVAAILTQSGDAVELAFQEAKNAQASVKNARDNAAAIPTLINKLQSATQSATNLLEAAKVSKRKSPVLPIQTRTIKR